MGVNSDEMSVKVQLNHLLVIFKSICGYLHRQDCRICRCVASVVREFLATNLHNKIF